MVARAASTSRFIAVVGHSPAALGCPPPAYGVAVVDDDELVMMRAGELDELLDDVRRRERARAVRIVVEESDGGDLCGIICGEIDESN